jgi:hypothetical protein
LKSQRKSQRSQEGEEKEEMRWRCGIEVRGKKSDQGSKKARLSLFLRDFSASPKVPNSPTSIKWTQTSTP